MLNCCKSHQGSSFSCYTDVAIISNPPSKEVEMRNVAVGITLMMALIIVGCSTTENPVSGTKEVPVNLSAAFSYSGTLSGLSKGLTLSSVDSVVIDSAIVVLARIKFESDLDSMDVDSSEADSLEHDDEGELNVKFRGPFVVHVRDVISVDFADETLPPGTYNTIKFKIHRLMPGEHHEDSDEHNGNPSWVTDLPYGSSIIVWGSVLKAGVWTPFEFKFDTELEFKVRGNFVVEEAVSSVNIALNFDMGQWFVNPFDGSLLDPTDLGPTTRELFLRAIKKSFGQGRCGRDDDDDGHPDED